MSDGKVLSCKCVHEEQDKLYGKGNRMHNECKAKSQGQRIWRCIVCKAEQTTNS